MLLQPPTVFAQIEMISAEMLPIDANQPAVNGKVDGIVQLRFKLTTDSTCGDQPTYFRLTFSDAPATNGSNSGITLLPSGQGGLRDIMGQGSQISYTVDNYGKADINVGSWPGNRLQWPSQGSNLTSEVLSATFNVKINASFIEANHNPAVKKISFYIVGWYGNHCDFNDSIKLDTGAVQGSKVKISGLKDVALTDRKTESDYMNVCLYSNTMEARLEFSGATQAHRNIFSLSNSAGSDIPYEVEVLDRQGIKKTVRKNTPNNGGDWSFSETDENCSGSGGWNMQLKIKAYPLSSTHPPGIYTDTMTVTASPK